MSNKKDKPLKVVTTDFKEETDAPVPNAAFHMQRFFSQMQIAKLAPEDMLVLTLGRQVADVTKTEIMGQLQRMTEHMQCKVVVLNPSDSLEVIRSAAAQQARDQANAQEIISALVWAEEGSVHTCCHPKTDVTGSGPDRGAAITDFFAKLRARAG